MSATAPAIRVTLPFKSNSDVLELVYEDPGASIKYESSPALDSSTPNLGYP